MDPLLAEGRLYWCAVTLYGAAAILFLSSLVFSSSRLGVWATKLTAATLPLHGAAIVVRWLAIGHGPYINRYEVFSSHVWVALAMFVVLQHRMPSLYALGAAVLPMAFLFMGWGALSPRQPEPLPPALRSYWLLLHVSLAKLAFGAIVLSFAISVVYLVQHAVLATTVQANGGTLVLAGRSMGAQGLLARLPDAEQLDDLGYRFLGLGFLLLGMVIIAGSIWAYEAWGSYWNWDPIEVWSLAAWLTYGAALHLRVTYGWRGVRAACVTVPAVAVSLIAFFAVAFLAQTIHTYVVQ